MDILRKILYQKITKLNTHQDLIIMPQGKVYNYVTMCKRLSVMLEI